MTDHLYYTLAAVLYTECLATIMVNMTILAAIFLKWKTHRSLQTIYKILGCLSLSRCLHLLSILFFYIIVVFYPWVLLGNIFATAAKVEIMFLYYTNLWFATILCVFYCVKITSYNNSLWIFLKMKISTVIYWFLLASLLFSVSSSFPFGFNMVNLEPESLINSTIEYTTIYNNGTVIKHQKRLLIFLIGSCPPFLIFCVTICLLLHSLWMHTRRMRSSGSNFRCPNLESHFSAVKSMSLFLVLQMIYFIVTIVNIAGRMKDYKVWRLVLPIISCSSLFLHSLHIISSNSDLKKTCLSVLHAITGGDRR
ncbi:hypothetical protein GDO78_021190 [Eleutherodactylus coqui]|uniref:Taste receptor type 2 n=1 Tax=Eleutherodactylus coqui TaxID=57060 RepID=A0A8J6EA10_ELECQ|nr:hypothetical protein GDO78_021190 [Eleutherodactylus coqui]